MRTPLALSAWARPFSDLITAMQDAIAAPDRSGLFALFSQSPADPANDAHRNRYRFGARSLRSESRGPKVSLNRSLSLHADNERTMRTTTGRNRRSSMTFSGEPRHPEIALWRVWPECSVNAATLLVSGSPSCDTSPPLTPRAGKPEHFKDDSMRPEIGSPEARDVRLGSPSP